jgi:hypothetical protein
LQRIGGAAALVCAATYLVGFVLLVTVLAPTGYGTTDIDPLAVVTLNHERPGLLIAWFILVGVTLLRDRSRSG